MRQITLGIMLAVSFYAMKWIAESGGMMNDIGKFEFKMAKSND